MATDLLLMNFKSVAVLHIQLVRAICRLNTTTIEEEADRVWCLALSFAEGIHQLLQLGRTLDLKEDFIVVIGDFDIQVLRNGGLWLLASGASFIVGHFESLEFGNRLMDGSWGTCECEDRRE